MQLKEATQNKLWSKETHSSPSHRRLKTLTLPPFKSSTFLLYHAERFQSENISAGRGLRELCSQFLHLKTGPRPSSPDPSSSAVLLHLPEESLNTPIPPRSWGASQFNKPETENSMQTTPLLRGDKGKQINPQGETEAEFWLSPPCR